MARALLAQGDRASAQQYVRETWRSDSMSADLEAQVIESFGELADRADHKARMDRRLYAEDIDDGMRAAQRLGGNELAIAKARIAVTARPAMPGPCSKPSPARRATDAGYIFSRAQWLRRNDRINEAAQVMLSAPNDPAVVHDTNEWWIERRLVARKLLDADNPQAAYRVARDAATPTKENSAHRASIHGGLDRAALSQRPEHGAAPFCADCDRHAQSDLARARGILAGTRRRGGRPDR